MTTLRAQTLVKNILSTYAQATEEQQEQGAVWYAQARNLAKSLSEASGKTLEQVATAISHLSPRLSWKRNVFAAEALILRNEHAPGVLSRSIENARKALSSDDPLSTLSGPKTTAFAQNILGFGDVITVDVWAARIALGDRSSAVTISKKTYSIFAEAYRIAAKRAKVSPSEIQAVTWIVARGKSK